MTEEGRLRSRPGLRGLRPRPSEPEAWRSPSGRCRSTRRARRLRSRSRPNLRRRPARPAARPRRGPATRRPDHPARPARRLEELGLMAHNRTHATPRPPSARPARHKAALAPPHRSKASQSKASQRRNRGLRRLLVPEAELEKHQGDLDKLGLTVLPVVVNDPAAVRAEMRRDRKSTRLNSSHVKISYAVFCLKKKKK